MKKCPFCAENIQEEAIKCRYCSEFLYGDHPEKAVKKPSTFLEKVPWGVGFLFMGPFVLPIVWGNRRYSKEYKILVTVIVIVVTMILLVAVVFAIKAIIGYYDQLMKLFNGAY